MHKTKAIGAELKEKDTLNQLFKLRDIMNTLMRKYEVLKSIFNTDFNNGRIRRTIIYNIICRVIIAKVIRKISFFKVYLIT